MKRKPVLFIPPLIPTGIWQNGLESGGMNKNPLECTGIQRNGAEFHWNGQESGRMDRNPEEWTGIWQNGQESRGMDK